MEEGKRLITRKAEGQNTVCLVYESCILVGQKE